MPTPLILLDSDGCVLDSMEYKQESLFAPLFIRTFRLSEIAEEATTVWRFVSLHSRLRGANRFVLLTKAVALLHQYPSPRLRDYPLPALSTLSELGGADGSVTTSTLPDLVARTADDTDARRELETVLTWSNDVDAAVHTDFSAVTPFRNAVSVIQRLKPTTSVAVVSQTPQETLEMEWTHAQLKAHVDAFYGQYPGGKREVITSLTADNGTMVDQKVLMIGDAPGDYQATQNTRAAFYPIVPGEEEESWERFDHEFLPLFLDGGYTATLQRTLVDEFFAALPEDPPWKKY